MQRMQLSPVLRARADAPRARFSDSACSSPASVYLSAAESVFSDDRPAAPVGALPPLAAFCLLRTCRAQAAEAEPPVPGLPLVCAWYLP